MVTQTQIRTTASRVATSWRPVARLKLIEKWMKNRRATTFIHVKRENNKVADLLANIRVEHDQVLQSGTINILHDQTQLQACTSLLNLETRAKHNFGQLL